jgi:D-alanyl-D-alanine carboxypeptidase
LHNELAAKSGMINQVRSLSGYLTNPSTGRRLAFSILANDVTGEADQGVLKLHEEVIHLADQWLTTASPATVTTKAGE